MMKKNVFNVTYVKYNDMWYATGYAPLLGKVMQVGETPKCAINRLYEFVNDVMDGGCHW